MNILKNLTLAFILICFFSCSSDDDTSETNGINALNLVVNFNENPAPGASVATIQAASTNTLSFSITSQTPSGALSINPSTGELKVANASLFDFETNPIIKATISIIDLSDSASVTATINLNDLDDIAHFLSTSEAAYTAAADGDWILISEAEYNALANNLNEVSRAGTTEMEYNTTPDPYVSGSVGHTWSNITTTSTIPNAGYVFAFKYKSYGASNDSTSKVKQSSTLNNDGFSDLGNALPSHSTTGENDCFVLKGSNNPVSNLGYLAFYNTSEIKIIHDTTKPGLYYSPGDSPTLNATLNDYKILYQGLSTTQKQW